MPGVAGVEEDRIAGLECGVVEFIDGFPGGGLGEARVGVVSVGGDKVAAGLSAAAGENQE